MTPSIPIFRNKINALEDFRGGVKVARDFAAYSLIQRNCITLAGRL